MRELLWLYFGVGLGSALYGSILGWKSLSEGAKKAPYLHGLVMLATITFVTAFWPVLLIVTFLESKDA
jgi:hypothetical protein